MPFFLGLKYQNNFDVMSAWVIYIWVTQYVCVITASGFVKKKGRKTKPNENTVFCPKHHDYGLHTEILSKEVLLKIDETEVCKWEIFKCRKGLALLIHLPGMAHVVYVVHAVPARSGQVVDSIPLTLRTSDLNIGFRQLYSFTFLPY